MSNLFKWFNSNIDYKGCKSLILFLAIFKYRVSRFSNFPKVLRESICLNLLLLNLYENINIILIFF